MIECEKYQVFICKIHKKRILHFKKEDSYFNETECWDCIKNANDTRWKKENKKIANEAINISEEKSK